MTTTPVTATYTLTLPVTVMVSHTGAVAVGHANGMVAMSRFSERAGRLAAAFGPGDHDVTDANVAALSDVTVYDLADCLA